MVYAIVACSIAFVFVVVLCPMSDVDAFVLSSISFTLLYFYDRLVLIPHHPRDLLSTSYSRGKGRKVSRPDASLAASHFASSSPCKRKTSFSLFFTLRVMIC